MNNLIIIIYFSNSIKDETFESKNYIKEMNLAHSRTHFRRRSNRLKVKMNEKSNPVYKLSPAFATLREGLNVDSDIDVVHYLQNVFKLRENMESD